MVNDNLEGILLIDKPEGWTSFDVVAKVRGVIKQSSGNKIKIGHTGTLDPFATGLLILVLGTYTKRASEFSKLDKTYEAKLVLGSTSTTGDPEGEIILRSDEKPAEDNIKAVLKGFVGEIEQKPHIYSAVKINGQRAYKLARKGQIPDIKTRKITVHSINEVKYNYPELSFIASVSSGTYIRTLAEDIGQKLSTGAYLSALMRQAVGRFDVSDALSLQNIDYDAIKKHLNR